MEWPPLPSSYVQFEESIPMILDLVLRDYLKEDLTYRDFRDVAYAWRKDTEKKHPSSRELSSVMTGHASNINAKSSQLSFFFFNLRRYSQTSWYRREEDVVAIVQTLRRTKVIPYIPALGTKLGPHPGHMRKRTNNRQTLQRVWIGNSCL